MHTHRWCRWARHPDGAERTISKDHMTKNELRQLAVASRRAASDHDRSLWDMLIFERAHKLAAFQRARRVHIYHSMDSEVQTMPFIEYAWATGKDVFVPSVVPGTATMVHIGVTYRTSWRVGPMGLLEPVTDANSVLLDASAFDSTSVIVAPVIAFDSSCNRLGYGKGMYDRFLVETSAPTIGLAYEVQRTREVPMEAHDVGLSCVVTEQRTYVSPGL